MTHSNEIRYSVRHKCDIWPSSMRYMVPQHTVPVVHNVDVKNKNPHLTISLWDKVIFSIWFFT